MAPNDIAYFLEAARQEHFGRAARIAGVTQPAITKAVRRLEESTGVTLFERGGGGVRLTAAGRLFLDAAQRFEAQHAELVRVAGELRAQQAGLLRVGTTNPEGANPLVAALADLLDTRPGLRVSLVIDTSDRLADAVDRGELDLAVAPSYPGIRHGCARLALGEDSVRAAARADHPLFARATLALADLEGCGWIMPSQGSASRRVATAILVEAGLPMPRVAMEAEYISSAVMGVLARTDLVGLVPDALLAAWAGRVAALPLPALEIRRGLALLTRAGATWSPLMADLRDRLLARTSIPAR